MLIGKLKSKVNSTYNPIDIRWKKTSSPQTLPGTIWLNLVLTKQKSDRVSIEARMWLPFFPDRDPSKSSKIAAWGNGNATMLGEFVNFNWLVFTVNPPMKWEIRVLHKAQKIITINGSWICWDIFSTLNCIFIQFCSRRKKNHECLVYARLCGMYWRHSDKQEQYWYCLHTVCILGQWFSTRGHFALQGTSGPIWNHLGLSQLCRWQWYWHLAGRGRDAD